MEPLDDIVTLAELAKKVGVTERTLQEWCRKRKLPAMKICGQWVLHRELLLAHVRSESLTSDVTQEDFREALRGRR